MRTTAYGVKTKLDRRLYQDNAGSNGRIWGRASRHSGLRAASHRNVGFVASTPPPGLQDEGSAQRAAAGCAKTNGRPTRPLPSHAIPTHTIRRTQDAAQLSGLPDNSPQTGEGCLPSNQRPRTRHIEARLQKVSGCACSVLLVSHRTVKPGERRRRLADRFGVITKAMG